MTRFVFILFFAYNELCVVEIGNSKENKFDIIEETEELVV